MPRKPRFFLPEIPICYANCCGKLGGAIGAGWAKTLQLAGSAAVTFRTTVAAVFGGMAAKASGGNFAQGAKTAAIQHLFNEELSELAAQEGDWVNPTGGKVRGCEKPGLGCGNFGASRGKRIHAGADYIATPGQDVVAVADGTVTKVGYPYPDDLSYRYIAIETTDGHVVRQLYVDPANGIEQGSTVSAGQSLGTYQQLGTRYPGITEHVHVDIWVNNGTASLWKTGATNVDPTTLIPSP